MPGTRQNRVPVLRPLAILDLPEAGILQPGPRRFMCYIGEADTVVDVVLGIIAGIEGWERKHLRGG